MHKQTQGNGTIPICKRFQDIRRAAPLTAIVALMSFGAVPPAGYAAPADDYTREIMAEGSRLETLGQAQREREKLEKSMAKSRPAASGAKKTAPTPAPTAAVATPPKETNESFETKLRATFPASFALYSLLSPEDKAAVRTEYDKSTSPGAARFHPVVSKIIAFSTKKR